MIDMESYCKTQHEPRADHSLPAWHADLSHYRSPSIWRAIWQLANTVVPYVGLWVLMVLSIQRGYSYGLTLILAVIAAAFLVRIFVLLHDCVHGSFFPSKVANTFFGHALGLLILTPFHDWRFSHLRHHATYANLDTRGFGDVWTMTRTEYDSLSKAKQLGYRLYRNPLVLIVLGAGFLFLLRFRLTTHKGTRKERLSVLYTNLLILGMVLLASWSIGLKTYLLIQIPVIWMAGVAGIWLFYVQHQFEGVYWARTEQWNAVHAGVDGSSFYKLPALLRWFSANIGYHHVHHLSPRIPNYRLKRCCDAVPALRAKRPLTIRESLACLSLKLWDEERKSLVGFP